MKGSMSTVFLCSVLSSSERVESAATAVQPNPANSEKNARPLRPIFSKRPSDIKAKRAITPLSSKRVRNKNSVTSCGRKESTANAPDKSPSHKNEVSHGCAPESALSSPPTASSDSLPNSSKSSVQGEYFPNAA